MHAYAYPTHTESYVLDAEDRACLATLGFQPAEDGTFQWTAEEFDEVIAQLAFAAEDGDAVASDLAGFLMFVEASVPAHSHLHEVLP